MGDNAGQSVLIVGEKQARAGNKFKEVGKYGEVIVPAGSGANFLAL